MTYVRILYILNTLSKIFLHRSIYMALNQLVDAQDVRFVLFDLLKTNELGMSFGQFQDFDRDVYEEVLNLAETIAKDEIYEASAAGDKSGCNYDSKTKGVTIPAAYHGPLDAYYEAGFFGLGDRPEIGGMGMPQEIAMSCYEFFLAGSVPLLMYPGLTHGAMRVIDDCGQGPIRDICIEKMLAGKWGGTMCLTEADAGSDVGLLKSKAVKQDDGTYHIQGQNIFISSGDNDYYENMVHLKLARVEGAPAGTKGLSIFLIPKYRINEDGSLGDCNDVTCAGIEHKMGIKGSATCTMSFGDNNQCVGYLLGKEQQGMKIMFNMMNEERIGVGVMGLALSSTAYMHAVTYAKNRVQGKNIADMMNPEAKPVTIVEHPDVKRMLLKMKSYVEAMRVFAYYMSRNETLENALNEDAAKEARAIGDLLRPVLKAGCTDAAVDITSQAVQVYGGYGYCSDYPVEQLMRDAKITAIYEGTNGIQAADLLLRKILMNKDQYNYSILKKRVLETIGNAKSVVDDEIISDLQDALAGVDSSVEFLKEEMNAGKFPFIFSQAKPFLDVMFIFVLAWFHVIALNEAIPQLKNIIGDLNGIEKRKKIEENLRASHVQGRIFSAEYFFNSELPKLKGMVEAIKKTDKSIIKMSPHLFTGALEE